MSEYTSGTQALQGRVVDHDPEPWAYSRTSKTGPGPFGTPDRAATRIDGAMMYFPRPEFLVRDNQHLWWARWAFHDERGPAERLDYYKDGRDWLNRKLGDQGHLSDEDEFARRVFTKLVALA